MVQVFSRSTAIFYPMRWTEDNFLTNDWFKRTSPSLCVMTGLEQKKREKGGGASCSEAVEPVRPPKGDLSQVTWERYLSNNSRLQKLSCTTGKPTSFISVSRCLKFSSKRGRLEATDTPPSWRRGLRHRVRTRRNSCRLVQQRRVRGRPGGHV